MYSRLRTNLPKEIMIYSEGTDFFDENLPSFVGHKDVLEYLEKFSSTNGVVDQISFSSTVTSCEKINSTLWKVTIDKNGTNEIEYFDAVAVCNGHYNCPFTPALAGIENFKGRMLHSRDYDGPEDFTQQRVLYVVPSASATF